MHLAPGSLVDRYTVASVIGEGGMATVYKVRHNVLGSLHALKVLTVSTPGLRERLRNEGRVQAGLRHPNILPVTDVIDVGGAPGLVMELVDGPDLDAMLRAQRLGYEQIDALARDILGAVGAAHAQGLVHRDLKPANILLQVTDDRIVPKITDFGLAKALTLDGAPSRTRTGAVMGTPHYMAPEQVRDAKHVGPEADVFALGAILYEMVTGRRAFDGSDLFEIFSAVAQGRFVPPRDLAPDLPPRMEQAILQALRVDPALRVRDCRTLLALWNGEVPADDGSVASSRSGPWDPEVLQRARAISSSSGASGAEARSGSTFPGTLARDGSGARAGRSAPPRSVVTMGLLLGGSGVVAALGGAILVALVGAGGWLAWSWSNRPVAVVPVPTPPPVVAPAPAPDAPAPAPGPPADAPDPPAEAPAPDPEPAPVAPAPGEPDRGVPEPAPAPVPTPAPPEPDPVAPAPAPAPADPAPATELPPDLDPRVTRPGKREDALITRYGRMPDATDLIFRVLKTDPAADVQVVAVGVLRDRWRSGRYDDAAHQRAMVWCARHGRAVDARAACLRTLGELGDASVGAVLGAVAGNASGDVKEAAQVGCRRWAERHPGERCGE